MAQKLYTEEDVLKMLRRFHTLEFNVQLSMSKLTPVQINEISDEEIFKQSVSAMEEHYGSGCDAEIDAYFRGAIWYREQLKKK